MKYGYCYETKIGVLCLIEEHGALLRCGFDWDETCIQKETALIKMGIKQVVEYLEGTRKHFSIPLKLTGTAFEKSVYETLQNTTYGETISYQMLAKKVSRPNSYRAVGNALGKNPLLLFVPCHRVISANGRIGGFTGGLETKRILLDLERGIHANC